MASLNRNSTSLNTENHFTLIPRDEYETIMKDAMIRYPRFDGTDYAGHRLLTYLFRKEDLEWLRNQQSAQPAT